VVETQRKDPVAAEESFSESKSRAWRIVKPMVKPFLPLCYKVFPESKNIGRYRRQFGRFPDIIRPKTFNEKVLRDMLFDRNPNLNVYADKLRAREFVRSRLGTDQYLTKLYAVVASADEINHLSLPAQFVMKPNHESGRIKIVRDCANLPPGELESLATAWLKENYYDNVQEWAYKDIEPRIFFEELLEFEGDIPDDWKFFCFDGEPQIVDIHRGRFVRHQRNLYDMNLSLLPVKYKYENFKGRIITPPNFDKMLEVVRRLSSGTDFLRVDLYNIKGRIVFGELTSHPANAMGVFEPAEWDLKLGSYWH
jgi:hypothetical protein